MREEISEPQHWRSHTHRNAVTGASWVAGRRAAESADLFASLPVEVVDAAFADESIDTKPVRGLRRDLASPRSTDPAGATEQNSPSEGKDRLQSLSNQLDMLQTQQEHLQRLLAQVRDS